MFFFSKKNETQKKKTIKRKRLFSPLHFLTNILYNRRPSMMDATWPNYFSLSLLSSECCSFLEWNESTYATCQNSREDGRVECVCVCVCSRCLVGERLPRIWKTGTPTHCPSIENSHFEIVSSRRDWANMNKSWDQEKTHAMRKNTSIISQWERLQ